MAKEDIKNEDIEKETEPVENEATANEAEEAEKQEEAVADEKTEEAVADEKTEEADSSDKKKAKKKKKDKKDEQIEELNDRLLRNMAEFENFRNRTEVEKSVRFDMGAKSIVEKILPVVDNFERGMETLSEEEKDSPFAQGMEAIYKQLITTLEEAGVKPIEAVGQEFNPDFHNAVMHDENEEFGENTVSQEFQKGYMYKESVVRHSMVKVSN